MKRKLGRSNIEVNTLDIGCGPLGTGLLTGKFSPGASFAQDDVRTHADWHPGFDSAPRWKKTPAPCSTAPLTPDQMAKIDRILERG